MLPTAHSCETGMIALLMRRKTGAVIDDGANETHAMRARPVALQHRWLAQTRAVVMLAALVVAELAVLSALPAGASAPAAIPGAAIAKPTLQTLVQFDFRPPMWGMPEATTWTHMDFSIIELAPGKSFDTNAGWYTSTDGPFLIVVLSGELDIVPNGPASVYPGDRTQQPRQIDAGDLASLGPDDALVFSVVDSAVGTNPGGEPLMALFGLTGSEDFSVPGAFSTPLDRSELDFQYIDGMSVLPTAGATVSILRVELLPYDSFVFDPEEMEHYLPVFDPFHAQGLQMAYGELEEWSPVTETIPIHSSSALMYPELGTHTLFDLGDEPVDLYFFVVERYPASATPTP
jgi:hypothetical protein